MPSVLVQGDPVIIVHRTRTGADARGNDVFSETQQTVNYCAIQPGRSTEDVQGTEEVTSDVTVFFPDGTNITALDAFITPDGLRYEVQGSPNQSKSPWSGIVSFVEVQGRLVTGGSV